MRYCGKSLMYAAGTQLSCCWQHVPFLQLGIYIWPVLFAESTLCCLQELTEKAPELPQDIRWHFIGHLQSNKAKALLGGFAAVVV